MIKYKINVTEELSKKGFTSTKIRREKLLSESTMNRIRNNKDINTTTLNALCIMLRCQPSDIIEIAVSDDDKIKYF